MNKSELYDRILCVFFPRRCKYCGEVIKPSQRLCDKCQKNLPRIEAPVCFKCGKSKNDCNCKGKSAYYDRITAPFYYTGAIEKAVNRLKFQHRDFLCEAYAEDMADCVRENYENTFYDFVCCVPFSKRDIKKRPFNQSELLAKHLAEKLGVEYRDALVRLYDSGVQHRLGAGLRTGNVFGVYDVNGNVSVEGRSVLLVDDIRTTGATLNECAKMLKIHGAANVDCVTFAVSKLKIDSKT
jgi:ComF family protein